MLQILIKVVMTCALATSALSKPMNIHNPRTPSPVVPFENGTIPVLPRDINSKVTYRQATKDTILSRAESRAASRGRALQPRQSARVYPTCDSSAGTAYIPQSGFVNFPGYSLGTASANFLDGYFVSTTPEIACVMLCETTNGCTAGYWAGGNTCYLRMGTIAGTNMVPRPGTDRVTFIRGDCASLEGQINNSTIMEACCNNPPPATIGRCTYSGYQNLGNYCLNTRNQYTTANRIATTTVAGGNNADTVLKNCVQYCTDYTNNGRTRSNHLGCTIAAATYYSASGGPNCAIYGGQPKTMVASDSDYTITAIAGTCSQGRANGIPQSGVNSGCYSPQSGP